MKSLLKYFFILFAVAATIHSCKKDPPQSDPVDFGYNYFPDQVGSYIIYQVDSIDYDDPLPRPPDTTRYLLKEVIASSFPDNSGRPTLRLERFYKIYNDSVPYDSMNWTGPRVWTANKTASTVEKREENIPYLKLVFPTNEGQEWNGNVYNTLGQKAYEIISTNVPETINSVSFDSVVTVKQFERINFIEYRYEAEKYARNVGLVYKVRDSIYHGGDSVNAKKGYKFKQKIVSYGY